MSHAIYQTPAIILKTKNMRESNKLLTLYTQKFGLIYASTQSIRELKSKMRFHTNVLSLVDVDVVRGRDIWKLTGIHEQYSSLKLAGTDWYPLIHRISTLILRLCSGEEAHDEIWDDIYRLYDLIQLPNQVEKEDYQSIEIIFVVRLLNNLGYWQDEKPFLGIDSPFLKEHYEYVRTNKTSLIGGINEGIQSSQL